MRCFAAGTVLALTFSAAAIAGPAAELLGYDPEAAPTQRCQQLASTAGILRVGLTRTNKPLSERVSSYLLIAGHVGEARSVCPDAQKPAAVTLAALGPVSWDAVACQAAAEAAKGAPLARRKVLEDAKNKEHPDVIAGYAEGVADALQPIREICDPHPSFAHLEVAKLDYRAVAKSQRSLRGCLLWGSAASREYDVAKKLAEAKGRAAGLAHLETKGILATAQAQLVCDAHAEKSGTVKMSSFQTMMYSLVKTAIESIPEKPASK